MTQKATRAHISLLICSKLPKKMKMCSLKLVTPREFLLLQKVITISRFSQLMRVSVHSDPLLIQILSSSSNRLSKAKHLSLKSFRIASLTQIRCQVSLANKHSNTFHVDWMVVWLSWPWIIIHLPIPLLSLRTNKTILRDRTILSFKKRKMNFKSASLQVVCGHSANKKIKFHIRTLCSQAMKEIHTLQLWKTWMSHLVLIILDKVVTKWFCNNSLSLNLLIRKPKNHLVLLKIHSRMWTKPQDTLSTSWT